MAYAPLKKGKLIVGPDANYVSEGIALARGKAEGYGGHSLLRKLLKKSLSPALWFLLILMGFPRILIWTTVQAND